jgi:transposase
MRKIKDLLRLKFERKLSHRQIAASLDISVGSVHDYLQRAQQANLTWPQAQQISEIQLEKSLFPSTPLLPDEAIPLPDWQQVASELTRKGVTLFLLWEEYRAKQPTGIGYSQFCKRFAAYKATLDPRMRQDHKAGEKLFVDYTGLTLPLTNADTGEITPVQIFVATLGASSYTYAEATLTQSVPDWIGAHVRAFAFFGGVPQLLVCDNLRAGITKACFYEPGVQRTYQEMATHYGCAVLPARVRKPRDKAKVEAGVQSVEQRLLAPLRNHTFFCLPTINQALAQQLLALNTRPMQTTKQSRTDLFEAHDRPALRPLPNRAYEVGLWEKARVHLDYHIEYDHRFYSVPYTLLKQKVDVREAGNVIEIFYQGERIASHIRPPKYARSTLDIHMPAAHQEVTRWSSSHLLERAARCGPKTLLVTEAILLRGEHVELGYRSTLGLLRLVEKYGGPPMEAACEVALARGMANYQGVKALLVSLANTAALLPPVPDLPPVQHDNVRGAGYYTSPAEAQGAPPEA